MSTGRSHTANGRRVPPRKRSSFGFTMFEVSVTLGIITMMALIIEGSLESARKAERRLDAVRRATERGERLTYDLLEEVNGARKLFSGDAQGQGYLNALELDRDPLIAGGRLPVFDEVNPLGPDAPGDPRTGNVLVFARETVAAPAVADSGSGAVRYIDLYRFVAVYATQTSRTLISDPPSQNARDLVIWRSLRYANFTQIDEISDAGEKISVIADIVTRFGCDYAWDPNADVDSAFYAMDALGGVSATPTPAFLIEEDIDESLRGRLLYGDTQLCDTDPTSYHRRAVLSVDNPVTWKPDGFEVKIVGTSGSRRVWMRVSVESPGGKGVVGVLASTVIASPRDL